MPPNFNLIEPLVVTQDQRSGSYNAGLGDANTSALGSFLEGFQKSARDWTVTRSLQLETQRENDPDKLAAEQLRRDLENEKLREAVYQSQVDSQYKVRKTEADIGSTESSTKLTDQNTRVRTKEADIIEKYGETEAALSIQGQRLDNTGKGLRNTGAGLNNQVTQLTLEQARRDASRDERLGDTEAELKLMEQTAKLRKTLEDRETPESRAGIASIQKNRIDAIKAGEDLYKSEEYKKAQQDYEKAFKKDDGKTAMAPMEIEAAQKDPNSRLSRAKARLDDFEKRKKKFDEIEQESFSMLPVRKEEQPMSPAQQQRQAAAERIGQIESNLMEAMSQREQQRIAQMDYAATAAVTKATDARMGFEISLRSAQELAEARRDGNPVNGRLNSRAIVNRLRGLVQGKKLWANTREQVEGYTQVLELGMGSKEDIAALLEDIENNERDPQERAAQKKSVYGAILESGNVEALQPIQKDLVTLGMGPEELFDPEKAVADTSTIISGNAVNVESEAVKKLRGNPNTMDYITAATKASKNGTQGFRIIQDRVDVGASGVDSSGATQQSQTVLIFEGSDGTQAKPVPLVPNDESNAMWAHMERVAAAGAAQAVQNQRAQGMIQANREEAGQRQEAMQNPAAPAAPLSIQDQIQQNIELEAQASIRNWEANSGRKATEILIRNARRRAADRYMSRLRNTQRQNGS